VREIERTFVCVCVVCWGVRVGVSGCECVWECVGVCARVFLSRQQVNFNFYHLLCVSIFSSLTHLHTHSHAHTQTHTQIHTPQSHTKTIHCHTNIAPTTPPLTHTHTHTHTHTCAHTHTHPHTHKHTHTHTHTAVRLEHHAFATNGCFNGHFERVASGPQVVRAR